MHQKYFGNVRKSERVNAQQEQPQMAFKLLDIYMNTVIHLQMKRVLNNRFAMKNLKNIKDLLNLPQILFADFQILEEAKFIQSRVGGANLMDKAGHVYYKQKVCTPKIHWDCRFRKKLKCKGRATTENFNIISLHGEHNHPAPSEDEIWAKTKTKSEQASN